MYDEYLKTGLKAVAAGGKIIKKGFLKTKEIKYKGFADPVTQYDKKSEEIIVSVIKKKYPSHGILTEEELSDDSNNDIKWIIDPIDGTINFIRSIPFVAISIALEISDEIVLGIVYNPMLNELFYAVKDKGAFLNNKKIFVSDVDRIENAVVVTGFPYVREGRIDDLIKPLPVIIKEYQGFRRLGSAAVDLAYVACGRFEAFYEENLNPWDTAAGIILVKEAGGIVTDYYNNKYSIYNKMILASNNKIHNNLSILLKNIKQR